MSQPAFEYTKTNTLLRSAVVPFRSPVQTKPAVWANQCGSYSYSWFDCLSLTHLLAHFFSYFFFCTNLFCVFYWRWILDVAKRCERHLKKKTKEYFHIIVLSWCGWRTTFVSSFIASTVVLCISLQFISNLLPFGYYGYWILRHAMHFAVTQTITKHVLYLRMNTWTIPAGSLYDGIACHVVDSNKINK